MSWVIVHILVVPFRNVTSLHLLPPRGPALWAGTPSMGAASSQLSLKFRFSPITPGSAPMAAVVFLQQMKEKLLKRSDHCCFVVFSPPIWNWSLCFCGFFPSDESFFCVRVCKCTIEHINSPHIRPERGSAGHGSFRTPSCFHACWNSLAWAVLFSVRDDTFIYLGLCF